MYLRIHNNGKVSVIHHKTPKDTQGLYYIKELPKREKIDTHNAQLYYDKEKGKAYYVYTERPEESEE